MSKKNSFGRPPATDAQFRRAARMFLRQWGVLAAYPHVQKKGHHGLQYRKAGKNIYVPVPPCSWDLFYAATRRWALLKALALEAAPTVLRLLKREAKDKVGPIS